MTIIDRIFTFWGFGCLAIVGGAFSAGAYHVITKQLTTAEYDPFPIFTYLIHRQAIILMAIVPAAIYNKDPLIRFRPKVWTLLLVRAFAAFTVATVGQFAIQLISLSDFMTIQAVTPILTTLIAWPIYRERPRITDIPILLLCLIGVVFIVQPGFIFQQSSHYSPPNFVGVLLAFVYMAANTVIFLCLRGLRGTPTTSIVAVYGGSTLVLAIALAFIMQSGWPPCSPMVRFQALSSGLLVALCIVLMTLASKSVPPGFVGLTPTIETVFHIVWQVAVTEQPLPLFSIIGTSLVIIAFLFFGFRTFLLHLIADRSNTKTADNPKWLRILTM